MDQTGWLVPTILLGILAFITTNIDNLLLLILVFSQPHFRKRHIVTGQYLGFIVIIIISMLGFFGKFLLPLAWIGFLGSVPIIIGVRELLCKQKLKQEGAVDTGKHVQPGLPQSFAYVALEPLLNPQTYRVSIITIGNGSDNISTYTPLFATESFIHVAVLISLFLLLVGVWCYLGHTLARLPTFAYAIEHYGSILLPFAYIILGLLIITRSGTFLLLSQL